MEENRKAWASPDGWRSARESACNAGVSGYSGSISGSGRSPGGGHDYPAPVSLPGKSQGQRNLVGYSPWGLKESHNLATEHGYF